MGTDFKHLVRVASTDLKGDTSVRNALAKIQGISHRLSSAILRATGVDEYKLLGYIGDEEIEKIEEALFDPIAAGLPEWILNRQKDPETGDSSLLIGSELLLQKKTDIDRMMRKRTWRGLRHSRGLKVRGQRTRATGRRSGALGVSRKKGGT
ncbi:MAG: 30S ribosomal protein S13 [Candidatus Heimdallarchaeota archaeon]|nr:30S ribosomal protein S13 [Candidatus Heimdallarchaeota archaeon]